MENRVLVKSQKSQGEITLFYSAYLSFGITNKYDSLFDTSDDELNHELSDRKTPL